MNITARYTMKYLLLETMTDFSILTIQDSIINCQQAAVQHYQKSRGDVLIPHIHLILNHLEIYDDYHQYEIHALQTALGDWALMIYNQTDDTTFFKQFSTEAALMEYCENVPDNIVLRYCSLSNQTIHNDFLY